MWRLTRIIFVTGLVLLVYFIWWRPLPILGDAVDLTVLLLIGLGLIEGLPISLGAAVVVGGAHMWISAISGPDYILSSIATVLVTWLFSRRIVTSRSAISFLSTVAAATAVGIVVLALSDLVVGLFDHQRIHVPWLTLVIFGTVQIIIHPMVLRLVWQLLGRGRYATLTSTLQRSF